MPTYKIPFQPVIDLFNKGVEDGEIKQFPGAEQIDMRGELGTFKITFRNQWVQLTSFIACSHVLRLRGGSVDVRFYLTSCVPQAADAYLLNLGLPYYPRYHLIQYSVHARKNIKKAEDELAIFLLTNGL